MIKYLSTVLVTIISAGMLATAYAGGLVDNTGYSSIMKFNLFNHPDGNKADPTYSLRLNNLKGQGGAWTFSSGDFMLNTVSPLMMHVLQNDNDSSDLRLRIHGKLFGGLDDGDGGGYVNNTTGMWDLDFTYKDNVSMVGDLITVGPQSDNNKGLFTPSAGDPKSHGIQLVKLSDKHNKLFESFIHDKNNHRLSCGNLNPMDNDPECGNPVGNGWLFNWSKVEKTWWKYSYTKWYDGKGDFLYTATKKPIPPGDIPPVPGDSVPLGMLFGAGLVVLGLTQRKRFTV